jgi:uncharacterized protein (TIRG00374 family)
MRVLKAIIKATISIILIVAIFYFIDIEVLFNKLLSINKYYIALAFILLTAQYLLSSFKWKIILMVDGINVPFRYLLQNYYIGNFISLFLPSSFGGDIYRIFALKKHSYDVSKNTSSVLFDRITGLFALISISIVSFALFGYFSKNLWLIVAYFIGVLLFIIITSDYAINKLAAIQHRVIRFPYKILKSFNQYIKQPKYLFPTLLVSFIFQANIVFIVSLYCAALNISVQYSYLFIVVPLIYLTEALPISINGLGVREGAFVFFFSQIGVTKESAMAVAILVISVRYLYCLSIGGSLLLRAILTNSIKLPKHNTLK